MDNIMLKQTARASARAAFEASRLASVEGCELVPSAHEVLSTCIALSAESLGAGPSAEAVGAEDALELSPNHLPSRFTHEIVKGEETGTVRCSSYSMALPAVPKGTSFFAQQEGADQ